MSDTGPGVGSGIVGPSIYLADLGGANKVWFTDASAPYPIPQPKTPYGSKTYTMRSGSPTDGNGYRAVQLTGTSPSFDDYPLKVTTITPQMLVALNLKYYAVPAAPMEFSLDNGANKYVVFFHPDGYLPSNWSENYRNQGIEIMLGVLTKLG